MTGTTNRADFSNPQGLLEAAVVEFIYQYTKDVIVVPQKLFF
jgi:hypothetical protein